MGGGGRGTFSKYHFFVLCNNYIGRPPKKSRSLLREVVKGGIDLVQHGGEKRGEVRVGQARVPARKRGRKSGGRGEGGVRVLCVSQRARV